MWVKEYADGTKIVEDRARGITWKKTINKGIVKVYMRQNDNDSPSLKGLEEYWHSRGAVLNHESGKTTDVLERIQGRQGDIWKTTTWDGKQYILSDEPKAYGKPVG